MSRKFLCWNKQRKQKTNKPNNNSGFLQTKNHGRIFIRNLRVILKTAVYPDVKRPRVKGEGTKEET